MFAHHFARKVYLYIFSTQNQNRDNALLLSRSLSGSAHAPKELLYLFTINHAINIGVIFAKQQWANITLSMIYDIRKSVNHLCCTYFCLKLNISHLLWNRTAQYTKYVLCTEDTIYSLQTFRLCIIKVASTSLNQLLSPIAPLHYRESNEAVEMSKWV